MPPASSQPLRRSTSILSAIARERLRVNTLYIVSADQMTRTQASRPQSFIEDTLLDPHAANNNVPGQQYSIGGGILAPLAKMIISNFQANAQDPPVFVPSIVDGLVIWRHTTAATGKDTYNLRVKYP